MFSPSDFLEKISPTSWGFIKYLHCDFSVTDSSTCESSFITMKHDERPRIPGRTDMEPIFGNALLFEKNYIFSHLISQKVLLDVVKMLSVNFF